MMQENVVDTIFVVGASRSGTTMLSRILAHNTRLFGLQELHYFGEIWDPREADELVNKESAEKIAALLLARQRKDIWGGEPDKQDYSEAKKIIQEQPLLTYSALYRRVVQYIATQNKKPIAVEQTPRYVYYLPSLLEKYPSSRVIEVVRDPRAVLYSQRQRWKMRSLGAKNVPLKEVLRVWLNYHATTMSQLWLSATKAGIAVENHPRVKRVKYEDLVNNPETTIRDVCAFLNIRYQAEMLSIPRIASSTSINAEKKTGISRESVDAWKLGLPRGECEICERIVRDTARYLGYDVPKKKPISYRALFHLLRFPLHAVGVVAANPRRAIIQLKGALRVR